MKIDKHIKNRDMGFDEHPSSNCHQVIENSIIKKWNEKKYKVILISGFDPVHKGHIECIQNARN